jgi:2-polyprenyl-3-methyl-5-hydroxy-6-metoxy-1,4-benzoquinol methylase
MMCCLCQSGSLSGFVRPDAKSSEPIALGECMKCGHVQQVNMPSPEELATYYSHHYRSDYKAVHVPKKKHVHRAGRVALERLQMLQKFQEGRRSLLDVGAGGGEFVYLASRLGWDATGIEPNLGYSEFARNEYGVEVATGSLDDEAHRRVDVVTMFHVLEHMPDPQASVQRVYERLTPQGLFFVEVPNLIQKDSSPHNIFFKAHVQYFNKDTLFFVTSRHFECLTMEDKGNLKAVFRRLDHLTKEAQLPSTEVVAANAARFRAKGWSEYLFEGGGWKKPFLRLRRSRVEAAFGSCSPRQTLDYLHYAGYNTPID